MVMKILIVVPDRVMIIELIYPVMTDLYLKTDSYPNRVGRTGNNQTSPEVTATVSLNDALTI